MNNTEEQYKTKYKKFISEINTFCRLMKLTKHDNMFMYYSNDIKIENLLDSSIFITIENPDNIFSENLYKYKNFPLIYVKWFFELLGNYPNNNNLNVCIVMSIDTVHEGLMYYCYSFISSKYTIITDSCYKTF